MAIYAEHGQVYVTFHPSLLLPLPAILHARICKVNNYFKESCNGYGKVISFFKSDNCSMMFRK